MNNSVLLQVWQTEVQLATLRYSTSAPMQLHTILLATDMYDLKSFKNKETFFDDYLIEEASGHIILESAFLDSFDNIQLLVKLLFKSDEPLVELCNGESLTIFDLANLKATIASIEDLDKFYPKWLTESCRENTIDEYGMFIGFIDYTQRNVCKNNLLLAVAQE